MKKYICLIISLTIFFACKKQEVKNLPVSTGNNYLDNVNGYLKSKLSAADYACIDWNSSVVSKQSDGWYLRFAVKGKTIATDFLLCFTDSLGHCKKGRFVHLDKDSSQHGRFDGTIVIATADRKKTATVAISNGRFTKIPAMASVDELDEDPDDGDDSEIVPGYSCSDCLPEVVVVGYLPSSGGGGGGISYADYIALSSIINSNAASTITPSTNTGTYSPLLSGGSASSSSSLKNSSDIQINFEASASKPGIDVSAFMKCFSEIPDAGSTCSIAIYTDLPVNDNPQYIFNILTGATGHVFLSMTKTNGSQSVTQYIGKTTSKAIAVLGFPVAGKIVDNTAHKYNASLTMYITPSQLQTAINKVISFGSTPSYDMWENNCVDYALSVLNTARPTNPLYVGMSIDPSTGDEYQTPQSLYIALQNLKNENGPDAPNITMDVVRNAGISHGACN